MSASIYIHFPYCLYKCHYCDFNSHATALSDIPFQDYLNSLKRELSSRKKLFEKTGRHFFNSSTNIDTVFFGGGTPSLMDGFLVEEILSELRNYFALTSNCEITLEANPKTLDEKKLSDFKKAGVNRLSVGVQSLNDKYLKKFGRIHSASEAFETLKLVSGAGLKSWNADLIFGFPDQTKDEWVETLTQALTLGPPHLSCYSFTVEEDAPYTQMVKSGQAKLPDGDLQAELFVLTRQILSRHGYDAYEFSNFCNPGHDCRHNVHYWNYDSYLGLGAGAVSHFSSPAKRDDDYFYRTTNFKKPKAYLDGIVQSQFFDEEIISKQTAMGEFVMMAIRKKEGVSLDAFKRCFGSDLPSVFADELKLLKHQGLIELNDSLTLTEPGVLLSNQVIEEFL